MIGDKADLANARAQADLARGRLVATLGELQQRLHPRALMKEAWEELRERGTEMADDAIRSAKEKPGRTAAIAGAVALFLARKPIAHGVMSLLDRRHDETEPAPEGSDED